MNLVKIIIWPRATNPLRRAIRFLTHGKGSHAAFLRGNGRIIENTWPKVRERAFRYGEVHQVEIYRLDGMTAAESSRLERWFDEELKNPPPYSWLDLFRYAFNLRPVEGRASFCSMWVCRGLRKNLPAEDQPLQRLEWRDYASPRDLRISPRLIRYWM